MTSSTSGMLTYEPIVAPSRQKKPLSEKPPYDYPPFHHGSQPLSFATANHWLRGSVTDSSVIKLHATSEVLVMSKLILIVLAHGHRGQSGNKLADQHAKLDAAVTQPDNALEPAARKALIRRSCRPLPFNTSG